MLFVNRKWKDLFAGNHEMGYLDDKDSVDFRIGKRFSILYCSPIESAASFQSRINASEQCNMICIQTTDPIIYDTIRLAALESKSTLCIAPRLSTAHELVSFVSQLANEPIQPILPPHDHSKRLEQTLQLIDADSFNLTSCFPSLQAIAKAELKELESALPQDVASRLYSFLQSSS